MNESEWLFGAPRVFELSTVHHSYDGYRSYYRSMSTVFFYACVEEALCRIDPFFRSKLVFINVRSLIKLVLLLSSPRD